MQIFLALFCKIFCYICKKELQMSYFGTNIKKIRQIKGLSQVAFAELIDLNRGVISSYEEGRAEPKIETVMRIANYFNLSSDQLISKQLTVNELVNFSELDEVINEKTEEISIKVNEISKNGLVKSFELQKILAKFDFIYKVDEDLAQKSIYKLGSYLFLKKISNEISALENENDYLFINENEVNVIYNLKDFDHSYKIVGQLSRNNFYPLQKILERISNLESKIN